MPTTTCCGTVPAAGADWDGDLTAGLYTVGQDLPEGTYTIQCAEGNTSIDLHIVSDEHGVEIYEDLSSNDYDAIDSERDDVSLPTGTVLFLSGNGTLYFHSSNAQVDAAAHRDRTQSAGQRCGVHPQRQ